MYNMEPNIVWHTHMPCSVPEIVTLSGCQIYRCANYTVKKYHFYLGLVRTVWRWIPFKSNKWQVRSPHDICQTCLHSIHLNVHLTPSAFLGTTFLCQFAHFGKTCQIQGQTRHWQMPNSPVTCSGSPITLPTPPITPPVHISRDYVTVPLAQGYAALLPLISPLLGHVETNRKDLQNPCKPLYNTL